MTLADGKIDNRLIRDGNVSTFVVDVIEASKAVPVLVDFWADWCQPCKTLTPLLEKAVLAANGAVKLVKINADENQELGTQLRIQSLPTVLAFKDGEAVDGFPGPCRKVKSTSSSPSWEAIRMPRRLMISWPKPENFWSGVRWNQRWSFMGRLARPTPQIWRRSAAWPGV